MRAFSTLASLLAFSPLLLVPSLARAEKTCSADSDCAKGWTCHDSGAVECAVPTCPAGQKCDSQPADCGRSEYKTCQPAPCVADSDCAEGMVCYTFTSQSCSVSDCAPNQECPEPVSDCTTTTQSACAPRYALPCTTASDCGAGFRCESTEQCSCSGSGSAPSPGGNGSGASAGSASIPPPEPSCTCEDSKEKSCHTDPVTCAADSDCLSGWTCATFVSSAPCASGAPDSDPGAGARGGAGPTPTPDCPPPTETKQCVPPYYSLIGGDTRGISHDSLGIPTSGSDTRGEASDGAITPPTNNADDKGSASDADSTSSAGCSVTPGARSTGSALALFGVLGLFSALRRRRAR